MIKLRNSSHLQGKRLLILGGQLKSCDIVNRASELGIYTIVTDWYEDSPAKRIADKSYDISTSDVEALLELVKKEKIDGVFTGYIDSTLPYYYEVCQRAELPCYLSKEALICGTNKQEFKKACEAVRIKTIPIVDIQKDGEKIYPIIVKPVDNSGSKGITVCYNDSMLDFACKRAERFSRSRSFICERFMDCDYVCAYYIVKDGKAKLALLMDKDMNHIGRGFVPYPTAFVSPSRYEDQFCKVQDEKVQRLVDHLKFRNGTFLISYFVNGVNFYAVEMAARLTATREYLFIQDAIGLDILEMHLNMALTGQFVCESQERREPKESQIYCMLFTFLKDGVIGPINGIEEIKALPEVQAVLLLRDIGAKIRADGSYGQLFSRIHLKTDSKEDMMQTIQNIDDLLQIYSTDGRPMLMPGFAAKRFLMEK